MAAGLAYCAVARKDQDEAVLVYRLTEVFVCLVPLICCLASFLKAFSFMQPIILEAIADYMHANGISLATQLAIRARGMADDASAKGKLVEFVLVAGLVEAAAGLKLADLPPFSAIADAGWLDSATIGPTMSTHYTLPLPEQTVKVIFYLSFSDSHSNPSC